MYNRYIPQPDGSYQRNRIPDPPARQAPPTEMREPPTGDLRQPGPPPPQQPRVRPSASLRPVPPKGRRPSEGGSIGDFLKQLLPNNFDTEDLLIVLLLLLMSGDCREDQNTALLTLVLYLFM